MAIKHKIIDKKGFTVIEMIVILAIISMGMIGVLSLTVQSMQIEYVNKSTLIAAQLAQEGLELARNERDNNWLAGSAWNAGFGNGTYKIDTAGLTGPGITMATAGLNINVNGYYTHNAGVSSSIYSRTVTIVLDTAVPPNYMKIQSRVYWKERGKDHYYVADTVLYDWK